jgi:hypothetical protein
MIAALVILAFLVASYGLARDWEWRSPWWFEWRGSLDDRPSMWIARVLQVPVWRRRGKWLSVRVDVHKFVRPDDPGCFHTHPAWAIRVPFWCGYVEEIYQRPGAWTSAREMRYWWPISFGLIAPSFAHRVHRLLGGGPSLSLWIRGPICADVKLLGEGWPELSLGDHPERN